MKIAIWHNLPSGGAKRVLVEHVRGLKLRGHVVEAWCPSSADAHYLPLSDFVAEHVVPLDWEEPPEGGHLGRYTYPLRSVRSRLRAMERNSETCAAQIAGRGFDVLFATSCLHLRVPPIGRMLQRMPRVLYLHEPMRKLYEAMPTLPWIARPTLRAHASSPFRATRALREWIRWQGLSLQAREERANAGAYDTILANSHYSRETILRVYGLDAGVCYPGVAAQARASDDDARENFVVGLGSENFEKGVDIALRAIASIAKPRRPPLVWIANMVSHPYHEDMRALADALDVDFTVKTMIPDAELVGLLRRATLMIYTSRLEPLGLAPLEAHACGTPVVAVAEGGVRETVRHLHNGVLVPNRDPDALGRAILSLLDDPALARRLGNHGRADVEALWSWDGAVDRMESYLRLATSAATPTPGARV